MARCFAFVTLFHLSLTFFFRPEVPFKESSKIYKGVFFWYFLFSAGCLLFLVGFKILFFWYCLPKTVDLEGLQNLLLLELEGFADFERILVLMCFLWSLVFKLEPTKPSEMVLS